MSLDLTYDGVSILDDVPPSSIQGTSRALDGDAGFGGFNVEDSAATVTLVGHRPVTISETSCAQPRLFTGWTIQRSMGRSKEDGLIVGDDRKFDVELVDLNAAFHFRLIIYTDGNRPAESIADRVAWLLGSTYMLNLVEDTGFVGGWSAMMEAVDYRGRVPADVLNDCLNRAGERLTYFAFWDPVALAVGLFLLETDDATYQSTIRISNVLGRPGRRDDVRAEHRRRAEPRADGRLLGRHRGIRRRQEGLAQPPGHRDHVHQAWHHDQPALRQDAGAGAHPGLELPRQALPRAGPDHLHDQRPARGRRAGHGRPAHRREVLPPAGLHDVDLDAGRDLHGRSRWTMR